MPKYDIECSIPPFPGGPAIGKIVRRLPMIDTPTVAEALTKLRVRVFSHDKEAFVYDGIPGVLWIELQRQTKTINRLMDELASLVGQEKAMELYANITKEVSSVKLD